MIIYGFRFFIFFFRRPRPIPGIASSSKLAEKEKDERMSAGRRRTTNQRTASLRTEGNRSSLNGSSDEESETDSRVNEDDEEDDNDSEPPRVSYFKYFIRIPDIMTKFRKISYWDQGSTGQNRSLWSNEKYLVVRESLNAKCPVHKKYVVLTRKFRIQMMTTCMFLFNSMTN